MTERSDEGVGGGRRGLPGLWAALVLVGLAVWSMQTGSVEGVGSGATNQTLTTSTSTSHFTHHLTGPDCVGGETTTQTVTLEDTLGPATIIIGDRDAGGTAFQVLAGTSNLNVNTHTQTDTFVCDAVGIPTLSEWAQIGMAALLLGGGLLALRRDSGQALRRRKQRSGVG